MASNGEPTVEERAEPIHPLTPTEMAVAEALHLQLKPLQIAEHRGVSERTVRVHISNAARKIPGDHPPIRRLREWFRGAPHWFETGT